MHALYKQSHIVTPPLNSSGLDVGVFDIHVEDIILTQLAQCINYNCPIT